MIARMTTEHQGLSGALAFLFIAASSLTASADTRDLLRFGTSNYVLESGAESPDRRFTLAWSVFPIKPTTPAFDWSKWNPENPFAPLDDPNVADNFDSKSTGKYVARTVLLDLEQKKATPLQSELCYISKRMETSSSSSWDISWIVNEGGKRVATICTYGRRGILSMDILTVDESEVREIPVLEQLWEFARADLKRSKVRNQSAFEHMDVKMKGKASESEFPMSYSVFPRAGEPTHDKDVILILKDGSITVQAAKGKVSTTNQTSGASISFAEADSRLNQLYKELQSTLSSERMANLRTEQRQWLKDRDQAVKTSLVKAGRSATTKEGKSLADQILLKWTVQRCEALESLSK
jgi:uncharacterized protein YecT (DUF1311 family)